MDKEGKMGKVTAEEMQGLMYGNSNNTSRSDGSSPKKVSASDMENLMAPYRSQEIKHTVLSPGTQPAQAAPAGASSRNQSDIMKEQLDAIKARRDDALIKAGAYHRAGMTQEEEEQLGIANRIYTDSVNAETKYKTQKNIEATEDYDPSKNKFKAGTAALASLQDFGQSFMQGAGVLSHYMGGGEAAYRQAGTSAKNLMDKGVSPKEALEASGMAKKDAAPITDSKTVAELKREKDRASVGTLEGIGLDTVGAVSGMAIPAAATAITKIPAAGLLLMSVSSLGHKYADAYEKYGNGDLAFALGLGAGAATYTTEQIGGVFGSLGGTKLGQAATKKLMSEAPGIYALATSTGGKWLRDAISEGVEEGAEDIVNYAIEKSLTGESDEMDNFGYDMLLGALAGGVLGGGNAAMRSVTYNRLGKALNASPAAVAQQVQEGMEKGAGTAPAIYAAEVQKNPSNQMVGRLYEANLTYDAESGLSKIQNDITQVSINEIKAMVSKADALAQAAQKLNVEATPQAVATAITDAQRTQSIKTAEDSVGQAFAPTVDNPANAGEKAYNSALAGVAANQGIAARINNDPAARQAFSQLTGVQFSGNTAQDIAAIEVATQNIAKSGKQAISQAEYAQRVAAAGEQAAAQFDADIQAQAEQMQQESLDRWLSVEQNTITDVDGKRRIKEITNTDVRGNTEIGYKKAEIPGSKKKAVAEVNNAAKYLGKTIVWFEGAVQVNGQYRLTNGYRAPDGTIYVNINSRDPLMVTFGHEMFHDLVADSKYSGLIDTLVENPDYADMVKGMMDAKTELYERNGIELDPNAAAEEVAADISGDLLGSRDMLEYIGARNTEAATGIKGFLNRILKKLKGKPSAEEAYNRLSESQKALLDGMEGKAETGVNGSESFSLIDVATNGMEIYETSLATQQLSESQKKKQYLALIKNQYRGRTARLERNGHVVYVRPDIQEAGKPIYGDRRSTANGAKALRNSLAEGDVFDLLENAEYDRSSRDTKNHKNADYFDYYVKTVQIDGKVYDLVADVKRAYGNSDGLYYTLYLVDNATKKAVVSQRPQTLSSSEPITASEMGSNSFSADMVPQSDTAVNNYSMQNSAEDASGKHSLMDIPAMDSEYSAAVESGNMQEAQRLVDEAAKENGYTIKAFHGTSRGDRVGNVFLPERATSGPMAFFTDNREVAERYSRDKADTSLAYDPDFDQYETQFRIKAGKLDVPLIKAWGYLPFDARNRITKKAGQVRMDMDTGDIIVDQSTNEANGGFQWQIKEFKGNTLAALNEQWLNSGTLFNEEGTYLDVLKAAGVFDEFAKVKGMGEPYFKDPKYREEKVYDVFLGIRNPFDVVQDVNNEFIDAFEEWYTEQDQSIYDRETADADMWDKNSITAEEFADRMREDVANGTTMSWTSIPDSMTDYLKSLGYDGIKDVGGKYSGSDHTVWIPFSSEQVKSAEPIVRDDAGNVIPLSERFNNSNNDIRYSLMEDAQYMADIDRVVSEATEKANDELKAAQAEVKNIRQQLADYRQQATAEAKNTAAWKDGEAKLIADLSEAQSKEKKARALASYMDEYNAISERYRGEVRATDTEALTQYNEKLSTLRSGFRGEMEKLAIEQGAFKRGEKAARDIYVPTSVNGQKVTRGTRTILEASQTPDSMLEEHAKEILAGARGYEVISDKKAQEYAERIIDKEGYDKADELFTNAVNGDQVLDKKTLVLGEYLYMEAAKAGDVKNAMRYAADVAAAATRAGQVVQAMRVLKKATPTGKLYYLNRMVDTMNKNIVDNGGDPIQIDEGLARKLLEAENIKDPKEQGKAVDETIDEIEQNIADQIPATAWDKWNAWRYLSMLGNIRTQVRNVVGNAAFMPLVATKNLLAAGMEKAFIRNGVRTKSSFFTKTNVGKRLMEFGKKDFDTVVDEIQGGGKYNQSSSIEEKRTIFKSKAIEGWRKLTNKAMDKGDEIFSKHHYARALAGYLYANHLDYDKITRNTPQAQELLNKARAYAILEAQKATFRDANQFASFINKTKRNLLKKAQTAETKGAKAGWYVGTAVAEGIMPFTKTPIDILARGAEYSPIGLIKGIKEAVYDVKKGNKTAAEAIDTLSSGLTGTGIFALGYFLQSLGLLAGALDDDKESKYKKDRGAQGFALHIGDKYYTIDWLAPFSLPLFTGAAVAETVENGDEVSFATLADVFSTISEPMLEMSMLQGVNSALSNGQYSSDSKIVSFMTNQITGYLSQANPTILGQIARAVDDTSRNAYYYDPNYKGFVQTGKVFGDKQIAKVPFASKALTSRVDLWGNKQENTGGSFFGRLAYNMLSPGYYSEESSDPVDVALTTLYEETEDTAVLPSKPSKTVTNNKTDYKMNAKQYEEYCIVKGQTAHKEIQAFINSAEYKKMSNEDRVDVLEHLYKYSTYRAQKNLLGDKYVASSTYSRCVKAEAYAKGGNPVYKYFLKG
jgi:hypothetical protein